LRQSDANHRDVAALVLVEAIGLLIESAKVYALSRRYWHLFCCATARTMR
jgi:hypothetical protein